MNEFTMLSRQRLTVGEHVRPKVRKRPEELWILSGRKGPLGT
jgi:hypothetical protein